MTSDLEREVRAAVKNGFLVMSMSKDWKQEIWHVDYRTTDSLQYQRVSDADPVTAMLKALRAGTRESKAQLKAAPKRRDMEDFL